MKKILLLTTLFLGLVTLHSSAQVTIDKDNQANFSQYHTFNWAPADVRTGANPVYHSDLILQNIQNNLADELNARGISQSDEPDLQITVHTYTENKTQRVMNGGYGYPYYGYGWGRGFLYSPFMYGYGPSYQNYHYTEGTLVIDMMDTHTHHLVWRGVAQGALNGPRGLEREIARGIHKMMKHYPAGLA
ncbi:DUF4136 domain-containing protein [Siphonobacter sp. SORGH_AS_0500]|uniref:DUF4136 domain-containing protein n=1 Tax=Siphonobacter sp. SORGH_AS_0500 TaxID=1864824 RepID=UPI00285E2751|nr:DUF4136 domain-containing protein [Siphonobacter sp. SORGH_AS_0500]MDR6193919.1 hypothetical protein [Siphonobacter sp. SORGH_AS_0500]